MQHNVYQYRLYWVAEDATTGETTQGSYAAFTTTGAALDRPNPPTKRFKYGRKICRHFHPATADNTRNEEDPQSNGRG